MFNKKPRRNFRQRKADSSDEEGSQRQQHKSGDGEEDDDNNGASAVNKPLKVAQGRGISCSSKREATPPKAASSDVEDGETLEATSESNEKRTDKDGGNKKTNAVLSFSGEKEEEQAFKLKKSSDKAVLFQVRKKEASTVKTTHSTGSPAGIQASHSPGQDYGSHPSPYSSEHDSCDGGSDDDNSVETGSRSSSSSSSESSCPASDPVIIPKAAEIKAARRQRRANRAPKQFIPLGRDGHSSAGSTPGRYSRDEEDDRDDDDNEDELDDHERIIEFAPRQKSIRERIAKILGGSEGSLSGTDGEEQELWEETQIGKGVKRRPGEQSPSGSESSSCSSRWDRERQKKRSAGAKIPKIPPAISVSLVKKRITGKLDSLMEVHRARQAELRRMEGDIESAKTSVETLEESSSERQLQFYRAMTVYIHNLVECLREKIVDINSLELELHTLLSDQMEALLAQRRHRTKEQAQRLQQLSYGTAQQSDSANGTETQGKTSVAAEAEEDTQDIPEDTQPSAEEEEHLQKKMADILSRSEGVFSDVQDDFCDVKKILSRFEEWRASYSDSYHSAYISLCLPKLLNPIIRHQLLEWNPLKDAGGDFEHLPWFTALETFCHGHGHEELDHSDRQTLSNVMEKTVLPKITAYVEFVWDPMSHHQSVCLSELCHRLKDDYSIFEGEQSKPVKTLIEAVDRRLRSCVDEDVFIPLYPKRFLEDRSSPQCRFREQQFWMAIKLLGNMGKWDFLLPESVLKELMLDKLLNRYLMITLCSQAQSNTTVHACKKIADSLPLSWFSNSLPQIQNFRNYLVEKIHKLCKQQPPNDPTTRSIVVEVLQVLSRLRCHDSIMALAGKYHYEDVVYSHQLLNQEPA